MLKKFKGCLLGAAIGDALGMPNESTSPNLKKMKYGYRRPYKNHPNEGLNPGQYTDDTQVMILVATLIADGKYNDERYSTALRELYTQGKLLSLIHISEPTRRTPISYAVFCLKKKK